MNIKLNKDESLFRNESVCVMDAKAVTIDHTLINLFMMLQYNGRRTKQVTRKEYDFDQMRHIFSILEGKGVLEGFDANPEAADVWLRSNLLNLVNRGKPGLERIAALRPIHLESFRIRNVNQARDYNTADQVYQFLSTDTVLRKALHEFLEDGWDNTTKNITVARNLDVDSLGILHLIKGAATDIVETPKEVGDTQPLLPQQVNLFCDDIRRLLAYKNLIPRNVLVDYLRTLISFHLALYLQKIIYLFPKMVELGTTDVTDDWQIVLDASDAPGSRIFEIATADAQRLYDGLHDYIRAVFQINAVFRVNNWPKTDSRHLSPALQMLKERGPEFDQKFAWRWNELLTLQVDEDKVALEDYVRYEASFFDKYVEAILRQRWAYQHKFHINLIDKLCQKDTDRGILTGGRTKRSKRRFVLGSKLLEALTQLLVLDWDETKNTFYTRSLSLEELVEQLRLRYGLLINGSGTDRYNNTDLNTNLAFQDNVRAFKEKLRQIGFYTDLSDAYLLQKIRPRYIIKQD